MYIKFANDKIQKLCEDQKTAVRKLGDRMTNKLYQRIMEIRAADNLLILKQVPSPRCHRLSGDRKNQYAVDLVHPKRLILIPIFEAEITEETVTEVVIQEIIDYH